MPTSLLDPNRTKTRRFSLRSFFKVRAEWTLVCLTRNLLKLYRSKLATVASV